MFSLIRNVLGSASTGTTTADNGHDDMPTTTTTTPSAFALVSSSADPTPTPTAPANPNPNPNPSQDRTWTNELPPLRASLPALEKIVNAKGEEVKQTKLTVADDDALAKLKRDYVDDEDENEEQTGNGHGSEEKGMNQAGGVQDTDAAMEDTTGIDVVNGESADPAAEPTDDRAQNGMKEDEDQDDDEMPKKPVPEGTCCECEDQPADLICQQCEGDAFCEVCFQSLHRKGKRAVHTVVRLRPEQQAPAGGQQSMAAMDAGKVTASGGTKRTAADRAAADELDARLEASAEQLAASVATQDIGETFVERARYIPVRLTLNERKYLRLLEAALHVSEYTDRVDVLSYSSKTKRMVAQIKELVATLSGLVLACDYTVGQQLFQERNFQENAVFFQNVFELGRRHKMMNPDKMRTTFGKLMYILMDSQIAEVEEQLGFDCVRPIKTVYSELEAAGCLAVLRDPLIQTATMEISPQGKSRYQIQTEIRAKERAIESLARKYQRGQFDSEHVRQCIYSIGDNNAFLRFARDPCNEMADWLNLYFKPNEIERNFSLAISFGSGGARLSHDHTKQFHYVSQTLALWREIANDAFKLWYLADNDMLNPDNYYRLRDTGQGLNRVQGCPSISRAMQIILSRAQRKLGYWVGSSVVHLGDHNVPNSLMFVDKYSQVPRILLPICSVLRNVDKLMENEGLAKYIQDEYNGPETVKKYIAMDFFRHAFDGSGSDNFFDAGSCIDGRLTSAWNWCSRIEKKAYFPLFQLDPGYLGFDGQSGFS